ncbi:GTP-binding protein, partial [Rhizobium ruizarguesonis]
MNALVGQKVSITSRKAQTTRHRITGIQTTDDAQFVFVDTPGFQTRHATALNRSLNRAVTSTLTSVDAVLFVVEAGRYGPDDEKVLSLLPRETPVILIVNKVDRLDAYTRAEMVAVFLQDMAQVFPFAEIVPMSAKNRDDIDRLLGIVRPY